MASEKTSGLNVNQLQNAPNILPSIPSAPPSFPFPNVQPGNPPPLPPRYPAQNYFGYNARPFGSNYYGGYGFGGYGNQYGGLNGYGGYSSFSPFSNYNNYGTVNGPNDNSQSRFYQYVEESTRPTFQLIETVLRTFSSMTVLLESTHFALTNSFKAILNVAENFGKLRSTINQLFSTFALIRFIKWLYRKIVRSTDQNLINDQLWDKSLEKIEGENVHNSSFWPGFIVFSVFFIIPYMIHKLSSSITQMHIKGSDPREWHQCKEPIHVAIALYDFVARNNDELSVKAGQKVCLAPWSLQPKNSPGWCKAMYNMNVGLIPYNYVKVVGQLKKKEKDNDTSSPNENKSSTSENQRCSNNKDFETMKSDETI